MKRAHIVSSAVAVIVGVGAASADVLYDTLWITDDSAYETAYGNARSGRAVFGNLEDLQIADDFVVDGSSFPDGVRLTGVTQDSLCMLGNVPLDGFAVRVFADDGMSPLNDPLFDAAVPLDDALVTYVPDPMFGLIGYRFELDILPTSIVLGPGRYWIDIQPIDTSDQGDWYYQIADTDAVIDGWVHQRDDWYQWWWGAHAPATMAMRIEGVAVPGPSMGAPLLAAVVWGRRRKRSPCMEGRV
jgi:hypothetical protein